MNKNQKKKIVAGISITLCVALLAGAIGFAVKKANAKVISVIPVSDIVQDYYNQQVTVSGTITTSVTQKVQLDEDSIVKDVLVKEGDRVAEGTALMTYDMTLTALELEIAKLTKENNQNKLKQAQERLESLKNGGPITEDVEEPSDHKSDEPEAKDPEEDQDVAMDSRLDLYLFAMVTGSSQEALLQTMNYLEERNNPEAEVTPETPQEPTPTDPPEEPTPTQAPEEPEEPENPEEGPVVYEILDEASKPYKGTGSKEDPYCFLGSTKEGGVIVMGSFMNVMAGYDPTGEEQLSEQPYWYRIEFHKDDQIADTEKPETSLIGYYQAKGGQPMDPEEAKIYTLSGATLPGDDVTVLTPTPAPEVTPDPGMDDDFWDDGWGDDWGDDEEPSDDDEGISRKDAIKEKETEIKNLKLEIKSGDIKISKLEKKLANETVTSTIDGVVKVVGDPATGESEGEGFIVVESDTGLYVSGSVSELMLDDLEPGQLLTGNAYESGTTFQAEVKEIAEYPVDEDENNNYYMGIGNPNVSYYPFIAHISGEQNLRNGEYVDMVIESGELAGTGLYMDPAFVRSEGGEDYVLKEEDGRLKKQIVQANMGSDGYTIEVLEGLTREDKIAFPYGKGVKEGAMVKDGTLDELYGIY